VVELKHSLGSEDGGNSVAVASHWDKASWSFVPQETVRRRQPESNNPS
jgi:hypothetical protein